MMDKDVLVKVAEMWHSSEYSAYDIARELDIPVQQVHEMTDTLMRLEDIVKRRMLERVKDALGIE
jgi:hypothetical protein